MLRSCFYLYGGGLPRIWENERWSVRYQYCGSLIVSVFDSCSNLSFDAGSASVFASVLYGNDFYVRVYAATGNRFSDECGTEKCGDRFGVFGSRGIFDGGGNEPDCRIGRYCRERFGNAGRRCALYMDCDVFSADG